MDAKAYLAQVQQLATGGKSKDKARTRTPSTTSTSPSLLSYADSTVTRRRSGSSSTASEADEPAGRPPGWKGLNSPMPLPSGVSATRTPTHTFDTDFTPNPDDHYSLRHSEFGYDVNPEHRTTSQHTPGTSLRASEEEPSIWIYLGTYLSCQFTLLPRPARHQSRPDDRDPQTRFSSASGTSATFSAR